MQTTCACCAVAAATRGLGSARLERRQRKQKRVVQCGTNLNKKNTLSYVQASITCTDAHKQSVTECVPTCLFSCTCTCVLPMVLYRKHHQEKIAGVGGGMSSPHQKLQV